MPEIRRLYGAALTAALLLLSPGAQAHLLKLFASAENGQISGYVYFSGGAKVQQAQVNVSDSSGALLRELKTDPQGGFSYRSQNPVDHLISASTLDGHAAQWSISAAELGAQTESASPANSATTASASRDNLDQRIEAAVARQVRPLREAIERQQDKARLQDIFGALGYIVGLAGAALWWRSRRPATHN